MPRKIDIYRQLVYSANNKHDFEYFISTMQHKTCNAAVKSLNNNIKYFRTKNGKDYFTDGLYNYVAYISK